MPDPGNIDSERKRIRNHENHCNRQSTRSHRTLFPGLLCERTSLHLRPGYIEAQAEQCCKNVGAILEAAGTDFSKVVKTTCFLADMKDFAAFNAVYAKYFVSKPARSCVAVKELPKQVLCEIETVTLAD